jgi:ketosteroid isomerase-like protein
MSNAVEHELIATAHAWDRAMVTNDADAIGRFMADDWIIIGADGRTITKERFLAVVRSGALQHDVMESSDIVVRVYGDAALLLANGVSGGTWEGTAFREVERSSNVFVKQDGRWRCVLTHLSKLPAEA